MAARSAMGRLGTDLPEEPECVKRRSAHRQDRRRLREAHDTLKRARFLHERESERLASEVALQNVPPRRPAVSSAHPARSLSTPGAGGRTRVHSAALMLMSWVRVHALASPH